MNKFDEKYKLLIEEYQIEELSIQDIFNKLSEKSFDIIIMYDFIELLGNNSSSKFEQRNLLKNIITELKSYPEITDRIIKVYKDEDNTLIKRNDIIRILNSLYKNSNKKFEIHKQIRDKKANEFIQEKLQEILSV